jgi:hypothetical protein
MDRTQIIAEILRLKEKAIKAGFDFPSQPPQEASTETLEAFLIELREYIGEDKD